MRLLSRKAVFPIAAIALLLLCLGGYWLVSHRQAIPSGIEGTITYGPLCPAEPCSARPMFNFDIIALKQNGGEAGTTRPDAAGHYKLNLPPGIYHVKASRTFASDFDTNRPEATVTKGKFTRLDLSFDRGIR